MSNTINIHMNQTPFTGMQIKPVINNNQNPQLKVVGFEKQQIKQNVEVNISNEGRLKSENSSHNTNTANVSMQTSTWANKRGVEYNPNLGETFDYDEAMRLDEPGTYAKYKELRDKAWEFEYKWASFGSDDPTEEEFKEYEKTLLEASNISYDWFMRKCVPNGYLQNPAAGKYAILDSLESMYSTKGEETSFNTYGTAKEDGRSSLWRFHSKFNVLISDEMLKGLDKLKDLSKLSANDKDDLTKLLEKITTAVNKMKDAEKAYDGNLKQLQFGVKLWDNGDVTYHANYKGCENKDGIMANSAEELLEMLREKE